MLYASSYLKGVAYSWFKPLLLQYVEKKSVPVEFTTWKAYSDSLTRMYGDPNLVKAKTRELKALRQTSSVSAYVSEFRRIASYLEWNDSPLVEEFYTGLMGNVKDLLVNENPQPAGLEQLISASLRCDSRIIERIIEKRSERPAKPPFSGSNPKSSAPLAPHRPMTPSSQTPRAPQVLPPRPSNDGTSPMELDVQRYPQWTTEQKLQRLEYRKKNGLCVYCGSDKHNVQFCPTCPPRKPGQHSLSYIELETLTEASLPDSTNGDAQE